MRHHHQRFFWIFIIIIVLFLIVLAYFFNNYKNPKNVFMGWLVNPVYAQENGTESIQDFQSQVQINQDNTVDVREKIIYDFGASQRHGIYRDIPYKYYAKGGIFQVGFKVKSVIDENNQAYNYQISKYSGNYRITIGDPAKIISGTKTYIINYQMDRVINFFNDHDEFYWNVTGNDWQVPIDRTGVTIKLPKETKSSDLQAKCFTGPLGSTEQNCEITNVANNQVGYSVFQTLNPNEGLTVVLGWPKGVLTAPSILTQIKWILRDNPLMVLPLLCLLIMYLLWYFHGRDLGKKQSIIPYYEAPDNLLPAEIGSVIDERVNLADISSSIINLAVRGYIKIKQLEKGDWELRKIKDLSGLKDWEKEFADEIFQKKEAIKISELKNKFYLYLPKLKKDLYQSLVAKQYFPASPEKVRSMYAVIAFVLFFLGIIIVPFLGGGGLNIASLIISGIIIFWLGQYMPYKTKEGTRVYYEILGYKMYLSVAEKDRLKFHNAPEKKPEVFERHLPYAMVLGVEKKWANQFKDIYLQQPTWYEGNFTTFNTLFFIHNLSSLNNSTRSLMASRPSGAASGHSGFSGGFSGGGFGGGGGGSW